jgi:hypothetical protein
MNLQLNRVWRSVYIHNTFATMLGEILEISSLYILAKLAKISQKLYFFFLLVYFAIYYSEVAF